VKRAVFVLLLAVSLLACAGEPERAPSGLDADPFAPVSVVLDRLRAGEGASSRNGGICSGNLKLSLSKLIEAFAYRELPLRARIDEARRQARASDRRVLLDFVADWCGDCREVVRLSHQEPARSVIEERYVVVYVDVGRFDRHRALIEAHGVDRIAALVVLDPERGERVAKTTLEPLTGPQRGLTSDQLAAWLRDPR